MDNKIGVNRYKLEEIEKNIINYKLNILDETFTFNQSNYDLKYLICLHSFLFNDFYPNDEMGIRDFKSDEVKKIESYLNSIVYLCINEPDNIENILKLIEEIWHLQPFLMGNTRTLVAFLKVLSQSFMLPIEVDVNINIENSSNLFKYGDLVKSQFSK